MRDHTAVPIENFKGLWARGNTLDGCPLDHFTDSNNVDFNESNVEVRDAFRKSLTLTLPGPIDGTPALRTRVFTTVISNVTTSFFLILNQNGQFYSVKFLPALANAVLLHDFTGVGVFDFDVVNYGKRAFITFSNGRIGMDVVYRYDGTIFTEAAGVGPVNGNGAVYLTPANSATAGNVQAGIHYYSLAFEYDSGFISTFKTMVGVGAHPLGLNSTGGFKVDLTGILLGGANVVARWILATKVVPNAVIATDPTGNSNEFFFLQRIADNTTTTLTVDFFDNQLVESADYLYDLAEFIQGGVTIGMYHNRLVVGGTRAQGVTTAIIGASPISVVASFPNDPETFDRTTSLINIPAFGQASLVSIAGVPLEVGVTEVQEYRDVLYAWSISKTVAITDNGDTPDTWVPVTIDEGIGSFLHGVITVLDAGSVNINYLIVADKTGLYVFNGNYIKPELSWKIATLWQTIIKTPDVNNSLRGVMCFANDTLNKKFYISLEFDGLSNKPNEILLCDYSLVDINDLASYKQLRFSRWRYNNINPMGIWLYDSGSSVKLYCNDSINPTSSPVLYVLNGPDLGAGDEIVGAPYIQSALIHDEDRNILHFGSFRLRINGDGLATQTLTFTIINEDELRSVVLSPYVLPVILLGKEPTILAGFLSQNAMVKMATVADGYFNLNRLAVYIKPIYSELPL